MVTAACEAAWLAGPTVSAPSRIVAVANSPSVDYTPFLTTDGLDLYFSSNRGGNYDIYTSHRPTIAGTFGAPQLVAGVNSSSEESQMTLSRDGLEAFLDSNRGGNRDIWRATRAVATDPFGAFSDITEIVSSADEYNAVLSYDNLRIYFAADSRTGSIGLYDIWYADRPSRGQPFATPALFGANVIDTTSTDASPTLIATDRVILFASNRSGGSGGLDVWYATRPDTTSPFGTPKPVPNVNTAASDYTPYLRPDGCELFFASGRTGDDDIYISQITP
jgi:Tol biopolymer transport system component